MMGRMLSGVEADRARVRATALRIFREVFEQRPYTAPDMRKDFLAPPKPHQFRRLEPMGFGLEQDDWWIFSPEEATPDIVWPLQCGSIAESAGQYETLTLYQCRTITAREARGFAQRFSPFMLRCDYAMRDRGKLVSCSFIVSWIGGRWVDAGDGLKYGKFDVPSYGESVSAREALGISMFSTLALRQRYEWAVAIGVEKSPSVRFATDPTGMKEMFRIRDLPEGRDRRAALMTWVEDHWRQDRYDPDLEVYVRKHLRGAVSFSWQGMDCEVIPAPFDLERRDAFIAARNAMKEAGEEKRARP